MLGRRPSEVVRPSFDLFSYFDIPTRTSPNPPRVSNFTYMRPCISTPQANLSKLELTGVVNEMLHRDKLLRLFEILW